MKRRSGFTLVELLIVLAVIAALLATLTPVAVNAVRNANATRAAADMRTVREAMSSYFYVERPQSPISFGIDQLRGSYIQGAIANVSASIAHSGEGVYIITVEHTGAVPETDLNSVWNEVSDGKITTSVIRYW